MIGVIALAGILLFTGLSRGPALETGSWGLSFPQPGQSPTGNASPEALAAGVLRARICTLFYAMLAFSHGVAAVCRGAGYSKVPMFIMLGTWCIFRVAYIETVVHLHGSIALVFWAYPITWCMSSVLFLLYYRKSRWLERIQEKSVVKNQ